MDKTTESASMSTEIKEGIQIKGKDMLYLNAPEIYFPENAPLDTEKRELYEILNELFQDGGEGGDWQPPDFPEPQYNQIIFLVRIDSEQVGLPALIFNLSNKDSQTAFGTGQEIVDWGDGYIDNSEPNYDKCFTHCYSQSGEYVITINLTPESDCIRFLIQTYNSADNIILSGNYDPNNFVSYQLPPTKIAIHAIKIGKDAGLTTALTNLTQLEYVKFCGIPRFYNVAGGGVIFFNNCQTLKKVDFDVLPDNNTFNSASFVNTAISNTDFMINVTKMHPSLFISMPRLRTLNLPNVTEFTGSGSVISNNSSIYKIYLPKLENTNGAYIAQNSGTLIEVYAPNVAEINSSDFYGCYNLSKLTLADDCNLNGNTFSTCYSLFPVPTNQQNN